MTPLQNQLLRYAVSFLLANWGEDEAADLGLCDWEMKPALIRLLASPGIAEGPPDLEGEV